MRMRIDPSQSIEGQQRFRVLHATWRFAAEVVGAGGIELPGQPGVLAPEGSILLRESCDGRGLMLLADAAELAARFQLQPDGRYLQWCSGMLLYRMDQDWEVRAPGSNETVAAPLTQGHAGDYLWVQRFEKRNQTEFFMIPGGMTQGYVLCAF